MEDSSLSLFKSENPSKIWIKFVSKNLNQFAFTSPILLEIDVNKKGTILKKKMIAFVHNEYIIFYKDKSAKQPLAIIFYEFELKIEWLYSPTKQKDGKKIDKLIGFKFMKHLQKSIEFSFCQNTEDAAIAFQVIMTSKINTFGFHEMYKASKKIGKGSFASVYLVTKKTTEEEFAVKAFSKETLYAQPRGKESLVNELKIMRMLSHPNIIQLYEVCETENSIYMILELLKGGSLLEKIKEKKFFNEKEIFPILRGVLKGIEHVHERGIMHRDIKPENILFRTINCQESDVCIADFGLSTIVKEKQYLFFRCGTPGYVAPEVINLKDEKAVYSEVCDVFSLGVIFHILIFGKPPFNGKNYNEIIAENKLCKIDFNDVKYEKISPEAKELMMMMLEKVPTKRISLTKVLNHPFFSTEFNFIDWKKDMYNSSAEKGKNFNDKFSELNKSNIDRSPVNEKRLTIEGFFKSDEIQSDSSNLVTRDAALNGCIKTIETFQEHNSQKEMEIKKNNNLLIKIYRNPNLETQSPSLRRELEEERKRKEAILDIEPVKVFSPLISIKENYEEEEKK